MPDITMCTNEKCPLNKTCYRFTAIPSEYIQSYAEFKPFIDDVLDYADCEYFLEIINNNQNL